MDFGVEFTELSTDVLVVGGGSAGVMAAIKAHMSGADTLVLTKGPWPSGNSAKALAGYAAAFGHADERDNPDVHFADVVRNGIGLSNQKLVRKWVDSICGLTEEMVGWGLDLIREGNGFRQIPWEGHSYPRMVNHHRVTGKYLMKCLGEKSAALNIRALSHSILGGLFKTDGAVTGAWAFNYRTGETYLIRAKAVIMCTGGFGAMYPIGDNVGAVTGEGYSVAFESGAEAIGMEFGHFLATPVFPEKMQVKFVFMGFANGLLNEGNARLYNGHGERFMWRYFPETGEKKHCSEELCRRISQEIVEGRGGVHGGVYLDMSDVPDSLRQNDRYRRVFELADRAGMDLRRQPIELVTYPHDLVGGIKIDELGRTNVPGLYAAGEAAGGSHGASRFGGSALSDCLVFGAASGEDAAAEASRSPHAPIRTTDVRAVRDKLGQWMHGSGTIPPTAAIDRLRRLANTHLNMVRTKPGLQAVMAEVSEIKADVLPRIVAREDGAARHNAIRAAIEAEGQANLCEMIAVAALAREESRGGFFGGHYRTDFPDRDDRNWLANVVLARNCGEITVRREAPVTLDGLSDTVKQVMATAWEAPDSPEHYAEAE